jgi:hypothetical protein
MALFGGGSVIARAAAGAAKDAPGLSDEELAKRAAQPGAIGAFFRAEQKRREAAKATAAAPGPTGAGTAPSAAEAASSAQAAALAAATRQRRRAGTIQTLRGPAPMGTIAGGMTGALRPRTLLGT